MQKPKNILKPPPLLVLLHVGSHCTFNTDFCGNQAQAVLDNKRMALTNQSAVYDGHLLIAQEGSRNRKEVPFFSIAHNATVIILRRKRFSVRADHQPTDGLLHISGTSLKLE